MRARGAAPRTGRTHDLYHPGPTHSAQSPDSSPTGRDGALPPHPNALRATSPLDPHGCSAVVPTLGSRRTDERSSAAKCDRASRMSLTLDGETGIDREAEKSAKIW